MEPWAWDFKKRILVGLTKTTAHPVLAFLGPVEVRMNHMTARA